MPHLNWLETSIRPLVSAFSEKKTQLTLELKKSEFDILLTQLEDLYSNEGYELRMTLPEGWTLFWKRKEEGARAIMAHPQAEEWVATIALDLNFGQQLLSAFKVLERGQLFILSSLGRLDSVSNFECAISYGK